MLLQPLNELTLTLQIKAESPLLIKEGRYAEDQKTQWSDQVVQQLAGSRQGREAERQRKEIKARFPSSIPISRNSKDEIEAAIKADDPLEKVNRLRFYVPGSSTRGAWRSYLERWLRGFAPEEPRVCDPLEDKEDREFYSCSGYLSKRKVAVPAYANSCPVCRLFGNSGQGSRIAISDADRVNGVPRLGNVVSREHINIQRHNQQVKTPPGPFKFFALQDVEFLFTVRIRNFELIQVALVGEAIKAVAEHRILLGSGKSKGYGAVVFTRFGADLMQFGANASGKELRGIAEHPACTPAMRERYGLKAGVPVALPKAAWKQETPWRWSTQFEYAEFDPVASELAKQIDRMWPDVAKLSDRPQEATA
jgi:CRISPR/Cas system CSM-associated protein Csm3 (group 7 of RAMP superfamily)